MKYNIILFDLTEFRVDHYLTTNENAELYKQITKWCIILLLSIRRDFDG